MLANETMRKLLHDEYLRYVGMLALTARRERNAGIGGWVWQLSQQVADMSEWLKSYETKGCTAENWNTLIHATGVMWADWYDWYQRTYTNPSIYLDGISIDDWREIYPVTVEYFEMVRLGEVA